MLGLPSVFSARMPDFIHLAGRQVAQASPSHVETLLIAMQSKLMTLERVSSGSITSPGQKRALQQPASPGLAPLRSPLGACVASRRLASLKNYSKEVAVPFRIAEASSGRQLAGQWRTVWAPRTPQTERPPNRIAVAGGCCGHSLAPRTGSVISTGDTNPAFALKFTLEAPVANAWPAGPCPRSHPAATPFSPFAGMCAACKAARSPLPAAFMTAPEVLAAARSLVRGSCAGLLRHYGLSCHECVRAMSGKARCRRWGCCDLGVGRVLA